MQNLSKTSKNNKNIFRYWYGFLDVFRQTFIRSSGLSSRIQEKEKL